MLEAGDLVLFNYKGNTEDNLIGLVLGDHTATKAEGDIKDVYWMEKNRVSPVKAEYLERLNEKR